MNISTSQAGQLKPAINRIALALAVASVMGAMAITPALADGNGDRGDRQDQGNRGEHHDQGLHRGQYKNDRDRREYQPVYRPAYQQSYYYYSQPVYVPPPVYYDSRPSPGISLFLPLDIRF